MTDVALTKDKALALLNDNEKEMLSSDNVIGTVKSMKARGYTILHAKKIVEIIRS